MKKLLILLNVILFAETTLASEVKTSSLSAVKVASTNQLVQQCQKLFSEGDKLISEAAKQPGTHTSQVNKLKEKLSISKQQILQMDIPTQQKSCDKGLIALNSIKQRY